MTFTYPLMWNKVGSEKIPLPQPHMLIRFAVYRDSYLDTNPKIAIYHDTVFRGNTTPNHFHSQIDKPIKLEISLKSSLRSSQLECQTESARIEAYFSFYTPLLPLIISILQFLAHRIGISEIFPLDRKSYLTHAILPRTPSNVIM